jgi:hypothetical protein
MSQPPLTPADIERYALAAAGAWIEWWRAELRRDGRGMAGGWPGTRSEARARVTAHLAVALGNDFAVDTETLDALTDRAYAVARARWLSGATREPNE